MKALGVDVATKAGWALLESFAGDRVLETGIVNHSMPAAWELIERVVKNAHAQGARLAVLEQPFLGKDPNAMGVLARLLGRWEQVCEAHGLEVFLVYAKQWQLGAMTGLISRTSKRDACKKAAQAWCRSVYGLELDTDRADAVVMTTWAVKNLRMLEQRRAA